MHVDILTVPETPREVGYIDCIVCSCLAAGLFAACSNKYWHKMKHPVKIRCAERASDSLNYKQLGRARRVNSDDRIWPSASKCFLPLPFTWC